ALRADGGARPCARAARACRPRGARHAPARGAFGRRAPACRPRPCAPALAAARARRRAHRQPRRRELRTARRASCRALRTGCRGAARHARHEARQRGPKSLPTRARSARAMLTTAVGRYVPQALALWRRHPVEALLAVLGVVGGVAGLVAVMTMAQGARIELQRALGALGTGTMIVRGVGTARIGAGRAAALSSLLGDDLRHRVSVMQHASAVRSAYAEVAAAKTVATEREYAAAYGLSVAEGRFIAAYDVAREARVCVLGAQLARQLFPRGDALGSRMRLGAEWHTVIGVLASERRAAAPDDLGIDQDRLAIVPLAPVSRRTALDELLLQFADETDMTRAAAAVQRIVEYGSADGGFEYVMPIELMREKRRMQRVVTWLLA